MKTHAILLAAALSLAAAPTAHADDADDAYLDALHSHGITDVTGDQHLISMGHSVCTLLAEGYSMDALIDTAEMHERHGMSDDDMRFLVKAGAASYCPELIQ